jgi:hypothetical protein
MTMAQRCFTGSNRFMHRLSGLFRDCTELFIAHRMKPDQARPKLLSHDSVETSWLRKMILRVTRTRVFDLEQGRALR